jgi:hypothetical protein
MTQTEEFKNEFENGGTIAGWTKEEILNGTAPESVKLILKDIQGYTTLQEKVSIEIENFLLYNNIDYISQKEISERAQGIIDLILDYQQEK